MTAKPKTFVQSVLDHVTHMAFDETDAYDWDHVMVLNLASHSVDVWAYRNGKDVWSEDDFSAAETIYNNIYNHLNV